MLKKILKRIKIKKLKRYRKKLETKLFDLSIRLENELLNTPMNFHTMIKEDYKYTRSKIQELIDQINNTLQGDDCYLE